MHGDEERTRQVLTNLLTNALKYSTPTYPIQVRLSTEEEDVIVSVQDHGVGIPKDQQARLFERFYQAENAGQAESQDLDWDYISRRRSRNGKGDASG